MTNYLMKLGHKDIGFIVGHPDQESSMRSEKSFRKAFAEAKQEVNKSPIVRGYYTYRSGIDAPLYYSINPHGLQQYSPPTTKWR